MAHRLDPPRGRGPRTIFLRKCPGDVTQRERYPFVTRTHFGVVGVRRQRLVYNVLRAECNAIVGTETNRQREMLRRRHDLADLLVPGFDVECVHVFMDAAQFRLTRRRSGVFDSFLEISAIFH